MSLEWLTKSNLGIFASNHPFDDVPIIITFSGDPSSVISLVSGELPIGLSWEGFPNFIRISGTAIPDVDVTAYSFIFRVVDPSGAIIEQLFSLELLYSPVPRWVTPVQLGSFAESHSFNLHPLHISFSADSAVKLTLLNGELPAGLFFKLKPGYVEILGESSAITQKLHASWTFRLKNPNGTISDKTYYITIIPESEIPNLVNQPSFLGYIGAGQQGRFKVAATIGSNEVINYSIVETEEYPIPPGLGIDRTQGNIVYEAPVVSADTVSSFVIKAATEYVSRTMVCSVEVLTIPHIPAWITPLEPVEVSNGSYLEFRLRCFDPQHGKIIYSIDYSDAGFPFKLDSDGVIYGKAPLVKKQTSWTVIVKATVKHATFTGESDRAFTITVLKTNQYKVLEWRNRDIDFLDIKDGRRVVFDVGANSTKKITVKHSIVGGQLPPGLMLDKIQGCLVGFIDYHVLEKDYWFNISATDDVNKITKTIHMRIKPSLDYQFSTISIPLTGDIKQAWLTTNQNIINKTEMLVNVSVDTNHLAFPCMTLVKGLDNTLSDPIGIINKVAQNLQKMQLLIGPGENIIADDQNNILLYRSIIDPQEGSALIANHRNGSPNEVVPASIKGLREVFINECGFANNGFGSGASALPIVDPEDGSIVEVNVVTQGSGYINNPRVIIKGSGSGVDLKSIMTIDDITIIDAGTGWKVGERLFLDIGDNKIPAEMIVLNTENYGALTQVAVIDGGLYNKVPIGKIWLRNEEGEFASVSLRLSVKEVEVIESGQGYDFNKTIVSFEGTEVLESWQTTWEPILPITYLTPTLSNLAIYNSQLSVTKELDGFNWQVGDILWDTEGIFWQGETRFDEEFTTFDCYSTKLHERLEPIETIYDKLDSTHDYFNISYDITDNTLDLNWGKTVIDSGTTAFDFYESIFDSSTAPTLSRTLVRKIIRLTSPQVSGNNSVDWSL